VKSLIDFDYQSLMLKELVLEKKLVVAVSVKVGRTGQVTKTRWVAKAEPKPNA